MSVKQKIGNQNQYKNSESLLERAEKSIPLGAQTFSKSRTQYPFGVSPYFIERGQGSRVWDVDGNEYIDFVNALAAVTLGYCDPDVDDAVKHQMESGTIFTLSHPLEMQVAEKLVEMVPCAQKVRFGKNGSDATAGAIRLARAFTGRDHILVCGYHGWQDWYIAVTTKNKGIPESVQQFTHSFSYNDIEDFHKKLKLHKDQVAAVIIEPMNIDFPQEGYLEELKALTHQHGALLIFDETITGFRYDNGGAQALFGVTPDIATFGKGMANGYPISAVVGRKDIMELMEEIFFSFTFGGETLSLAAALATLTKLQKEPVLQSIHERGQDIINRTENLIRDHGLNDILSMSGHPSWTFLKIQDHKDYDAMTIKTFFMQEMFAHGILTLGTHNVSYAHSKNDIDVLMSVYDNFMKTLKLALDQNTLANLIRCEITRPLFKVR